MYNVGDLVYVPNAYEWVWKSCLTQVKEIVNSIQNVNVIKSHAIRRVHMNTT